jgi:hypothetical protein
MFADWMRPARLAVTAQQGVFAGFDENESDGMLLPQVFQKRGQFLKLVAFAGVHEKRSTREAAFACGVKLRKNRNQLDGKIVDAIKTHVLERVEDGALSRARESGEDDQLAGFVSIGWGVSSLSLVLAGSAMLAQFFTRR